MKGCARLDPEFSGVIRTIISKLILLHDYISMSELSYGFRNYNIAIETKTTNEIAGQVRVLVLQSVSFVVSLRTAARNGMSKKLQAFYATNCLAQEQGEGRHPAVST